MSDTVYAIASGKGGVGKTTTAINLGSMLADRGHRVVVVDTDLGMANLAGFLDFDIEEPTLHEVLADEADAEDAIYDAPGGIEVLPSATDIEAFAKSNPANLRGVVADLREEYDYVLLDTGAGVSYDTLVPLALADVVLLVATPDVASVRDTAKTGELADRVGTKVAGSVLTQRSSDILNATDVEETLGTDVLAVVPQDDAVPMGVDAGRPLAAFAPNAPAGQAYRELAAVVVGDAEPEPELDGTADEPANRADESADEADAAVDDGVAESGVESGNSPTAEAPTASDEPGDEPTDPLTGPDAAQQARAVIDAEADEPDDDLDEGEFDGPDDGQSSEEARSVDDLIDEHIGEDRLADDGRADDRQGSEQSRSPDDDPLGEADSLAEDPDIPDIEDLEADEFVNRVGEQSGGGRGGAEDSPDATDGPAANEAADLLTDDPSGNPLAGDDALAGDDSLSGEESLPGEESVSDETDAGPEKPDVGAVPFERDDADEPADGDRPERADAASALDDATLSDVSEGEDDDDGKLGVFGRIGSLFR